MSGNVNKNSILKNMSLSIVAQMVSLLCGFVLQMIVPKFIDQYQYSYWQTYILYVNYVGILHFGLLDGIVLRYSQYDYDQLNKANMRSQFTFLLAANTICSIVTLIVVSFSTESVTKTVFSFVAAGIIVKNVFTYASYTFQITNRINRYAQLIIIQRLSYGIITGLLICLKVNHFAWYCAAELLGDVVGIIFSLAINPELFAGRLAPFKSAFRELKKNISSGALLLVANWTANLIVGSAKMFIQWNCDTLTFGQVSFAFSIVNLFLVFISAISVVLFPSIKRMDEKILPQLYTKLRKGTSVLLFYIMVAYFPGCWLIKLWLPNYADSLIYVGMLLPTIIYSSKISLLTNNYLKFYRKERTLFTINVISIIFAIGLYFVASYVLNNVSAVLYSVFIVITFRSILSEYIVSKIIKQPVIKDQIVEFLLSVIFILSVQFFSPMVALIVYLVFLLVYTYINKNILREFYLTIIKKQYPKN